MEAQTHLWTKLFASVTLAAAFYVMSYIMLACGGRISSLVQLRSAGPLALLAMSGSISLVALAARCKASLPRGRALGAAHKGHFRVRHFGGVTASPYKSTCIGNDTKRYGGL